MTSINLHKNLSKSVCPFVTWDGGKDVFKLLTFFKLTPVLERG